MKSFLIKVNGEYYAGMKEFDNKPAVIMYAFREENAKVCEGLVNMKSHWERIYNAMKNGEVVNSIEIIMLL
jgi:hypothetical protein